MPQRFAWCNNVTLPAQGGRARCNNATLPVKELRHSKFERKFFAVFKVKYQEKISL